MAVTNVLLVRHAAPVTPSPGASPEVDNERSLTDAGSAAAIALAHQLETMPIAAIYSSPYRRAIQTVEPLAAALDLEVTSRDELAERWLADRILDDDLWLEAYRRTWGDLDFCPPGGESRRATQDRALAVLDDLRRRHEGEVVVASTHGGLIGCLLRALDDDLSLEEVLRMPTPAIFSLEHHDGDWHASTFAAITTSVGVRAARTEDIAAIADVALRSRRVARRGIYDDDYLRALTTEDAKRAARRCLEREGWRTWVGEIDGSVVAYATGGPWSEDPTGRTADIDDLYVDPDHFREGIGGLLLAHVERELIALGYRLVVLWVREDDVVLEAFYRAQGYDRQERHKQLMKDRPRRFRLWTKDLHSR